MKNHILLIIALAIAGHTASAQCFISPAGNKIAGFTSSCNGFQITGVIDDDISFGADCGDFVFIPPIADPNDNSISTFHHEENISFKIYPNPSNGYFYIESSFSDVLTEITIYDLIGRIVVREKISLNNKSAIDLSFTPDGVYFLRIRYNNHKEFIAKLVKVD